MMLMEIMCWAFGKAQCRFFGVFVQPSNLLLGLLLDLLRNLLLRICLVFWKLNFWLRKYFKILCMQNILEIVKTLKERSPSESIYYISSDPVFSFQSEINIEFNTFRLKTSVIMNIKFISWGPYGNTKVNFILC